MNSKTSKKIHILDYITRLVRPHILINCEAFDNYISNVSKVIIGTIEKKTDDCFWFECNDQELSGVIENIEYKDNKIHLSIESGYDIDLYLICKSNID